MRRSMTFTFLKLFVFLFALMVGWARPTCGEPKKPEMINIFVLGDMSGPYASVMAPTQVALDDCSAYINDKLGGVDGVPIKVTNFDTGGKMDVGLTAYSQAREIKPKPLVGFGYISSLNAALREQLIQDEIVFIATTAPDAIYPQGYTFGWFPLYPDWYGVFIDWLAKKEPSAKLAILTWDTAFGRGVMTRECAAYTKSKGIDLVAQEVFPINAVSVETQLRKIRARGAQWIYSNTTSGGAQLILRNAREMGFNIRLAGAEHMGDYSLSRLAGDELVNGTISSWYQTNFEDVDDPGMKIVIRYFEKGGYPEKYKTHSYPIMWTALGTAYEAIKKAVKEAGWERLDGNSVKEAMMTLRDFRPFGGLSYITYTKDRRTPTKAYMTEIRNGKMVRISDWMDCPDLRDPEMKLK